MDDTGIMAIPPWNRSYLSHVEIGSQIHRIWPISITKNPPFGGLLYGIPYNFTMNTKNNANRKALLLFFVFFVFLGLTGYAKKTIASEYINGDGYIYNTDCPTGILDATLSFGYYINGVYDSGANATGCESIYPVASTTRNTQIGNGYTSEKFFDATNQSGNIITEITLTAYPEIPYDNISTRIKTVTPYNGQQIATSTSYTFGFTGYLNEDDATEDTRVHFHFENSNKRFQQCADVICSDIAGGTATFDLYYPLDEDSLSLATYGDFTYSTTSSASWPIGRYYMKTTIERQDWCIAGLCFGTEELYATSTEFLIATTTKADDLVQKTVDFYESLAGEGNFEHCHISNLDLLECGADLIAYAFVPTDDALSYNGNLLKTHVLSKFPIGYVTEIVTQLGTTTVGTLPIISFTLPEALHMGGGSLELDLTNAFDTVLNATTSVFANESASSTETFGTITKRYWDMVLYALLGFYILGRILGSHLIDSLRPNSEYDYTKDGDISSSKYAQKNKKFLGR